MEQIKSFQTISTVVGHHTNCSVIFITQNLFHNLSIYRTISLNTDYFVIMKNKRDLKQIRTFGQQLCPDKPTWVIDSYYKAIEQPYSYLLIDCHMKTPSILQLRSNIFPHEQKDQPYTIYPKT